MYTPENIDHHRAMIKPMMEEVFTEDKQIYDKSVADCDRSSFKVPSTDGYEVEVFVYTPKSLKNSKSVPAYVWARGGGACVSEATDYHPSCCLTALNLNCIFFNVAFRNGPEVKCPQGQHDFVAALKHILANAAKFKVDSSNVCITGISGGGWIVCGAANLLAKANELHKVKALFIHTAMLSNETANYKREQLTDYERDWANEDLVQSSIYKLHATDFDKQANDD